MDKNQAPDNESMPASANHTPEAIIPNEAEKDNPEAQLQPRPRPGAVSVSISAAHDWSQPKPKKGFWGKLIDNIKDFLGNE